MTKKEIEKLRKEHAIDDVKDHFLLDAMNYAVSLLAEDKLTNKQKMAAKYLLIRAKKSVDTGWENYKSIQDMKETILKSLYKEFATENPTNIINRCEACGDLGFLEVLNGETNKYEIQTCDNCNYINPTPLEHYIFEYQIFIREIA